MVLKQRLEADGKSPWFENDVKMYGTQAALKICLLNWKFENDVKMYGTQAIICSKTC